ncbi:C40 family peptidase [Treponema primitia]|uniref:NlpC/P60 family protein n=1 Tax=Treponema primitia TaxID=88058 RepID=UPI0039816A42
MGVRWDRIFENEKRQFEKMTAQEKFAYFLLLQYGSPYGWGKENPESSDCSGAVCMALYAATGLLIRTTADDLYNRVFTVTNPGTALIRAAFFIADKGTAVHVAGLVNDGIILNSQEPGAQIRQLEDIARWFTRQGCTLVVRGLDPAALRRLAGEGKTVSGLDGEWGRYFE